MRCCRTDHDGTVVSQGVGRAVMRGALAESAEPPATLAASTPGRPLYEPLGYVTAAPSTWWASVWPLASGDMGGVRILVIDVVDSTLPPHRPGCDSMGR